MMVDSPETFLLRNLRVCKRMRLYFNFLFWRTLVAPRQIYLPSAYLEGLTKYNIPAFAVPFALFSNCGNTLLLK